MRRRLLAAVGAILAVGGGAAALTATHSPAPAGHVWVTPIAPTAHQAPSEPSHKQRPPTVRRHKALKAKGVRYSLSSVPCISTDCGPYAAALHWNLGNWGHTTTGYYVYLNTTSLGSQVDDVTSQTYVFPGGDCATSVTLGVRQHDNSGNTGPLYTSNYTTPACPQMVKVSTDGRTLQTSSGSPFLIVGDSPQSTLGNLSVANAESYLDDRASKGFNSVWFNLLCADYTYCATTGATYDGVKPFTTGTGPSTYDLSTPNSTYFSRMHTIIAYAKTKGIEVFLDPIETGTDQAGGSDCTSPGSTRWMSTLRANGDGTLSTTDKDYGYGQYLGTTFKDLNNIIWMSGNDYQCLSNTADNNDGKTVVNGIKNTDPSALQTMEPDYCSSFGYNCAGSSSLTAATGTSTGWSSLVDLNGAYTYAGAYGEVGAAYAQSSTKPAFLVESDYDQEALADTDGCSTERNCLMQEWWTVTSGGAGFLYGCACTTHLTNANYPNGMDTTAVTDIGYLENLMSTVDWPKLAPDTGHTFLTAGRGTCSATGSFASSNCATAALASDGSFGLIYDPAGTTLTVDTTKLTGAVTSRWYDPTNGTYQTATHGGTASAATYAVPAGGNSAGGTDWVLLLQDGPEGVTCTQNVTTSTFASAAASATNGQTLCLAAGTYSTWGGGTTASFTIAPQPGASPTFCFDLSNTHNLTIDGAHTGFDYTTPGIQSPAALSTAAAAASACPADFIEANSDNITIKNVAFSDCANGGGGCLNILGAGPNTLIDNIIHDYPACNSSGGVCSGGFWAGVSDSAITQGALHLYDYNASSVIKNNLFENISADAVDVGGYDQILGNDFINVSSPAADPRHTDVLQWGATEHNIVAKGNFVSGTCTQGLGAYDGTASNDIEDNVIANCGPNALVQAADTPGSTVKHNTVTASAMECGSKVGSPASTTDIESNIFQNGIDWGGVACTPSTDSHNMSYTSFGPIHSASDFLGTPTFVGGTTPTTYAGYALATGSAGRGGGADGQDVGARVSLYPRPTGLP